MTDIAMRNQNQMQPQADDTESLALRAENAETRIAAIKKIISATLKMTNPRDWVLINGIPYLTVTGAEKVARAWGISWDFAAETPEIKTDKSGYTSFTFYGTFYMGRDSISATGGRSAADPFFSGSPENKKSPDLIDIRNVRNSAYSNWLNNGIKRILGLRNLSVDDLKEAGLNLQSIKGFTHKDTGGNDKKQNQKDRSGENQETGRCQNCTKEIVSAVLNYSMEHYKRPLCRECQKLARERKI